MMAEDIVAAVCDALNENEGPLETSSGGCQDYITHVLYLQASPVVNPRQVWLQVPHVCLLCPPPPPPGAYHGDSVSGTGK